MKMKKLILLLSMSAILAGCKTDIITSISTDDLTSSNQKIINGIAEIEVITCNDYEDSRKDSRSLIEAKNKVSQILRNSNYLECYQKKMESFAVFETPIVVGSGRDGVEFLDGDIYILNRDDAYLTAMLNPSLIKRIESEESSLSMIGKVDLNIIIELKKGADFVPDLVWQGVYTSDTPSDIRKYPQIMHRFSGDGLDSMYITFSDVANSMLMKGKPAAVAWHPKALLESIKK